MFNPFSLQQYYFVAFANAIIPNTTAARMINTEYSFHHTLNQFALRFLSSTASTFALDASAK